VTRRFTPSYIVLPSVKTVGGGGQLWIALTSRQDYTRMDGILALKTTLVHINLNSVRQGSAFAAVLGWLHVSTLIPSHPSTGCATSPEWPQPDATSEAVLLGGRVMLFDFVLQAVRVLASQSFRNEYFAPLCLTTTLSARP